LTSSDRTQPPPLRRVREVLAYRNQFVSVFDDEVEVSGRGRGRYLRIVHLGDGLGVTILPILNDCVGLVRTYRYPLAEWQWGLPRGFSQDRDPEVTARAELREELGVTSAELRLLGHLTPDSGLLASRVAVMLACVAGIENHPREESQEVAASRWVSVPGMWAMAAAGELEDGMTLATLALAQATGILPSS
jgi:8-oxo-dGTP pyrophosphatase MutT (NUDIX family)